MEPGALIENRTFDEITVGETATLTRTLSRGHRSVRRDVKRCEPRARGCMSTHRDPARHSTTITPRSLTASGPSPAARTNSDELLHGRRVRRVAKPRVAGWAVLVVARQGRRRSAPAGTVPQRSGFHDVLLWTDDDRHHHHRLAGRPTASSDMREAVTPRLSSDTPRPPGARANRTSAGPAFPGAGSSSDSVSVRPVAPGPDPRECMRPPAPTRAALLRRTEPSSARTRPPSRSSLSDGLEAASPQTAVSAPEGN